MDYWTVELITGSFHIVVLTNFLMARSLFVQIEGADVIPERTTRICWMKSVALFNQAIE